MATVKVKWLNPNEGGRKNPPPTGRYYSVARFPDDKTWQNNAWSVIFELSPPQDVDDHKLSSGSVSFMMENAPMEKMSDYDSFEIYEGPHKVGIVFIEKS
ncbi:hypothetical protein FJU30_26640 [Affinibrenneria salicis]|uniref:Uncharacterized protein n=1 Tax=Affinibrenneria salicis TaxID=2590031 RepID=A0A5J5FQ78_9GAMM|nr:hypothetical protein [Affinibrenneria salicis]KAA8993527.1 hypothetical protein FJU30_26640 [Affinibrenneria salicis]